MTLSRADLEQDIQECYEAIRILQRRASWLELFLSGQIPAFKMPESYTPRVSDHALVQWMMRVLEEPIEEYRNIILTPKRAEMIRRGCSKIKHGKVHYIVENGTIVTCIRDGGPV